MNSLCTRFSADGFVGHSMRFQVELSSDLAPLLSAYHCDNCEPPLTTKTASFAGALDYIWVRCCIGTPCMLDAVFHLNSSCVACTCVAPHNAGMVCDCKEEIIVCAHSWAGAGL